jgi:hypothetical protein
VRGCFLLFFGIAIGAIALAIVQVFLSRPSPLTTQTANSTDLEILLRNQFLTQELQSAIARSRPAIPLTGVAVQGEPGQQLVVAGSLMLGRASAAIPVRVTLRPSLAQNKINFQVVQAQLGTFKLPGDLFSSLAQPINQEIDRALAGQSYRIVGISTTVDGLVVDVAVTP